MARIETEKKYILQERNLIIWERLEKGYSQSDIARMLNVHPSVIAKEIAKGELEKPSL